MTRYLVVLNEKDRLTSERGELVRVVMGEGRRRRPLVVR